MNTPEVPWRPVRYLTTDFITPDNIAIKEQAHALRRLSSIDDDYIRLVANFIRDEFTYPLDYFGVPSAGLSWKRYDKGRWWKYFYNKTMDYAWGFPVETILLKKGICIDTSLLMTTLLLAGSVPSRCVLGAVVNAKTNEVSGYHAWSTFIYQNRECIGETTIHFAAETIVRQDSVYNQDSDWANTNGIYYQPEADFDGSNYKAMGRLGPEMVALMGAPAQEVEHYGLQKTLELMQTKKKSIAKEWRKSEAITHNILKQAYGGI